MVIPLQSFAKLVINTEMVNTILYTIVTTVNNIDSHSNSPLESCGSRGSLLFTVLTTYLAMASELLRIGISFVFYHRTSVFSVFPCICPNIDNRESFPVVSSLILTRESCDVFAQVKDHVLFRGVRFTLDCKQIRFKCQNYTWKQGLTYTWYQIPT